MSQYPEGYTRVSDILADVGLSDKTHIPEQALERGSVIHKACELATHEALDWDTLHPDLHGYVHSWLAFVKEADPVIIEVEKPVFHDVLKIAGTPDLVAIIEGLPGIYDWKANSIPKHTKWQTALYAFMRGTNPGKRGGIALQADGSTAKLTRFEDLRDLTVALAAVTIYNAKRNG